MNQFETVENKRLKPLIENGTAQIVAAKFCGEFNKFLCEKYPWVGFSDKIDWEEVETQYLRFHWENANSQETINFLKKTCLNKFDEVCIVYGAREKGLIVKFNYLCVNLEHLVIFGWETHFIVGVKRNSYGVAELVQECFIEVDFSNWLTASC